MANREKGPGTRERSSAARAGRPSGGKSAGGGGNRKGGMGSGHAHSGHPPGSGGGTGAKTSKGGHTGQHPRSAATGKTGKDHKTKSSPPLRRVPGPAPRPKSNPSPTTHNRTQAPHGKSPARPHPERPYKELERFAKAKGFHVTSTTGGSHNKGSLHSKGRAIDVRVSNKSKAQVEQLIRDARAKGYVVRDERQRPSGQKVWSGPHIHLEIP